MQRSFKGFVLAELAAIVVVGGVVLAVLLVGGGRSRRMARMGDDIAHLQELATAGGTYAVGSGDKFWAFSWRAGQAPISPQDPNGAGLFVAADDLQAAANQCVYILRTTANRPLMPPISAFIPHISYSYLVLAAEQHLRLPQRAVVSSEDRHRLKWANDPLGYDQGLYTPNFGTSVGSSINWRHPYSSDFRPPTCFYDQSPVGSRIYQSGLTNLFYIPGGGVLRQALMSSVAFPSHKFMAGDYIARHMGARQVFCTSDEARLPMLMADASVEVRSAGESNVGCDPNTGQQTTLQYSPSVIDPPALPNPFVQGRFLWTRRRLDGRDFRGPEVPGF